MTLRMRMADRVSTAGAGERIREWDLVSDQILVLVGVSFALHAKNRVFIKMLTAKEASQLLHDDIQARG